MYNVELRLLVKLGCNISLIGFKDTIQQISSIVIYNAENMGDFCIFKGDEDIVYKQG